MVPSPVARNSPQPEDPIYFGSLCFIPHAPAALPIFEALLEGVDLTFGIIRLRADRSSILRLPDAIRPTATTSTSSLDILETAESESASIYLDDDLYPEDAIYPVKRDADDCVQDESCYINSSMTTPTRPVQVYMANLGETTGDSQSSHGRCETITLSESAMARVQAAVTGGTPLGSDVTREELMAYQKLLYEQAQRLRRRTEELDALQRRAEASSERRAQLSSLRSSASV